MAILVNFGCLINCLNDIDTSCSTERNGLPFLSYTSVIFSKVNFVLFMLKVTDSRDRKIYRLILKQMQTNNPNSKRVRGVLMIPDFLKFVKQVKFFMRLRYMHHEYNSFSQLFRICITCNICLFNISV